MSWSGLGALMFIRLKKDNAHFGHLQSDHLSHENEINTLILEMSNGTWPYEENFLLGK